MTISSISASSDLQDGITSMIFRGLNTACLRCWSSSITTMHPLHSRQCTTRWIQLLTTQKYAQSTVKRLARPRQAISGNPYK